MPKKTIQIILYLGLGIVGIILIIMGLGLLLEDHWAHLKHLIWVVAGISCLAAVLTGIQKNQYRALPPVIKHGIVAGLSIIVFIIFSQMVQIEKVRAGGVSPANHAEATDTLKSVEEIEAKMKALPKARTKKEMFENELKLLDILFSNPHIYHITTEELVKETTLFNTWSKFVRDGKKDMDSEIRELARQLESKVSAIQIKEFPEMRRIYVDQSVEALAVENISIYTEGADHSILNYTGTSLTGDAISGAEKEMKDIFTRFRFKEIRYRQYKGQTDYISYPHHTPADAEVVPYLLSDEN